MKNGIDAKKEDADELFSYNSNAIPVHQTHQDFLTKEDYRGKNRKRTRNEIKNNISKSLRYLKFTLQHTKKLVKEKDDKTKKYVDVKDDGKKHLYEMFNATELEPIFKSLLRDVNVDYQNNNSNYSYDFRTEEIARLMLELALDYLLRSKEFKDRQTTREIAKAISEDFKLLLKSSLDKFELTEEEKTKLEEEYKKITNVEIELLEEQLPELYWPYDEETHNITIKARDELILTISKLNLQLHYSRDKTGLKKQIKDGMNNIREIEKTIELMDEIKQKKIDYTESIEQIYNKIIPIKKYMCTVNPITDLDLKRSL